MYNGECAKLLEISVELGMLAGIADFVVVVFPTNMYFLLSTHLYCAHPPMNMIKYHMFSYPSD